MALLPLRKAYKQIKARKKNEEKKKKRVRKWKTPVVHTWKRSRKR